MEGARGDEKEGARGGGYGYKVMGRRRMRREGGGKGAKEGEGGRKGIKHGETLEEEEEEEE